MFSSRSFVLRCPRNPHSLDGPPEQNQAFTGLRLGGEGGLPFQSLCASQIQIHYPPKLKQTSERQLYGVVLTAGALQGEPGLWETGARMREYK